MIPEWTKVLRENLESWKKSMEEKKKERKTGKTGEAEERVRGVELIGARRGK